MKLTGKEKYYFDLGKKQKENDIKSHIVSIKRNYTGVLGEYAKGRLDAYNCLLSNIKNN